MRLKHLLRRVPPIARRDATIKALKADNRRLRGRLDPDDAALDDRPPDPTDYRGRAEQVRLVTGSGLFDADWYREQLAGQDVGDPVEHYLRTGHTEGLSPHPCFDAEHYRRQEGVPQLAVAPLLHYLRVGARGRISPHPGFRPRGYVRAHPDSTSAPGGPLGHFLAGHVAPAAAVLKDSGLTDPADFRAAATAAARLLHTTRNHDDLPRESPTFDDDAAAALVAELRADDSLLRDEPLVSIVLPTKDRAAVVPTAVASVLAQTYPHWELIVVDDGSRDETTEALADALHDERVHLVRHETNRGVAAARNTALARATGEYVAYLDSDNTWEPDFLEVQLRFARREQAPVTYGVSALVENQEEGERRYRGMPFSRAALRERNYIDCIVILHERRLLEEVGGFDETLRRNVDWDFLIRLADAAEFRYVPVIATQYDLWESGTGRITTDELASYRFAVRQRTLLDWDAAREEGREEGLTSVVVVAHDDVRATLTTVRLLIAGADRPLEVVVVDSRLPEEAATQLQLGLWQMPQVRIERLSQELPLEVARNVGAVRSRGEHLVFLTEHVWTEPGWLGPLVDGLAEHSVVAPVLLAPDGTVWSAGVQRVRGVPTDPWQAMPGDAPELRGTRQVPGVAAACLAARAADVIAVEGFDPLYVQDYVTADLSVRLAAATGRPAAVTGASTVGLRALPMPATRGSRWVSPTDNERRFAHLHREVTDPAPAGYRVTAWQRDEQEHLTGVLAHERPERPLRWAIKIGPPDLYRRARWGDWHFAVALRDSLERLGHEVTIDCRDAWYRPTAHLDDVVLVLRGRGPYRVNPAHTNVAWVISHPDEVSPAELKDFDLVFGASPRWCAAVADRTPAPVLPLLQCTDHRRFAPGPPDETRVHEVLAVANARGMRPSVGAALAGGIVPAVYGFQWDGLLPKGAWQGRNVPNDELPGVYRAAGVVLNDHWEDMRRDGLLSNRLFDLAACEARMVSDHLPEITEVFGDAVPTYREPGALPALVRDVLDDTPDKQQRRRELGELVRREHTFDARARTLSEHVERIRRGEHV